MDKWISVSNPPNEMGIYATLVKEGSAYRYSMQWFGEGVMFMIGTTHWFPLPEIPES